METDLIPSMKETLFAPTISDMGDSLTEIAELGLDAVLQDGLIKDIPVLGTIASLCKTGVNLKERNLIRQTARFISSFNDGSISEDRLLVYKEQLETDKKKAEKELGRVILLLDRMLEEQQAIMLGRFYNAYIKGAINWDKFVELSEVNARMFVSDFKELDSIARNPVQQTDEVSVRRLYKIQRLESLGLVTEYRIRLHSGNVLTYEDTNDRFVSSPLGSTFFSLMKRIE